MPPDLVRSTITSFADERIQVISQQVMTRAVLLQLVDKYGLYEKYRGRATDEEILERMRKDIKLSTVNADISDRSSGRRVNATIAFTISYDAPQPDQRAEGRERAGVALSQREREGAPAERRRDDRLPRAGGGSAGQADPGHRNEARRRSSAATSAACRIRRQSTCSSPIARSPSCSASNARSACSRTGSSPSKRSSPVVRPNCARRSEPAGERVLSPEERLRALQAQYASLSAVYGADHPDVRRMQAGDRGAQGRDGRVGQAQTTTDR